MIQAAAAARGWWLAGVLVFAWSVPGWAAPSARQAAPSADVQQLAKRKRAEDGPSPSRAFPLSGDLACVVAGAAGAAFALVVFTLPVLWLAWAGIWFAGPLFAAVAWAFLAVGAGGAVAWLVLALWSEVRSGIVLPTLVAAGLGAGITAVAGIAALVAWWSAFAFMAVWYGPPWNPLNPWEWGRGGQSRWEWRSYAWLGAGAFLVWTTGVVAAAVAGPTAAAFVYRKLGVPRRGREFHVDLLTPSAE